MKDDTTICYKHNTIKYLCTEIIKKFKKGNAVIEDIIPKIQEILLNATEAKKQGQRMENRLKKYRNSIEKLGFTRVYSGKKSK